MIELPLFPLNTVLFPGIPVQLHIFEERYREMIARCLATAEPFGVVLIKRGREALGPLAEPHLVGTTAQIIEREEFDDGRLNLRVVGQERFRINNLYHDQPYLVGQVELFPYAMGDMQVLERAAAGLRPLVLRYLNLLTEESDEVIGGEKLPAGPLELAYVAAFILQTSPANKQILLAEERALDLLNGLRRLYPRELALLNVLLDHEGGAFIGSFSAN